MGGDWDRRMRTYQNGPKRFWPEHFEDNRFADSVLKQRHREGTDVYDSFLPDEAPVISSDPMDSERNELWILNFLFEKTYGEFTSSIFEGTLNHHFQALIFEMRLQFFPWNGGGSAPIAIDRSSSAPWNMDLECVWGKLLSTTGTLDQSLRTLGGEVLFEILPLDFISAFILTKNRFPSAASVVILKIEVNTPTYSWVRAETADLFFSLAYLQFFSGKYFAAVFARSASQIASEFEVILKKESRDESSTCGWTWDWVVATCIQMTLKVNQKKIFFEFYPRMFMSCKNLLTFSFRSSSDQLHPSLWWMQ